MTRVDLLSLALPPVFLTSASYTAGLAGRLTEPALEPDRAIFEAEAPVELERRTIARERRDEGLPQAHPLEPAAGLVQECGADTLAPSIAPHDDVADLRPHRLAEEAGKDGIAEEAHDLDAVVRHEQAVAGIVQKAPYGGLVELGGRALAGGELRQEADRRRHVLRRRVADREPGRVGLLRTG